MNSVFHTAWELLQNVIEWFFPPTLLAEPIVSIMLDGLFFIGGVWFLAMLVFKPCYMFARWVFGKFRGE